jgi:diguanylate cyclase (GGDEF)-like protein
MKKKSILAFAIIAVVLYWVLDAYSNVVLYHSALGNELLLKSSHAHPFFKIIIALLVGGVGLMPLFYRPLDKREAQTRVEDLEMLRGLSEILFSSLSTKINVTKSLEKLENLLSLHSVILFVYQKETLLLYNENDFIKRSFRSKEIFPFKSNPSSSEVEVVASTCFVEKRPFSEDRIKSDGETYTLLSFMLKEDKSDKAIGNLMLASKDAKRLSLYTQTIERFTEMLSFILLLQGKKEHLEQLNVQTSNENHHYDKNLNIMTHIKVLEHIDYEFNRNKRYRTEVTLMIFEIDMLKNLSTIFPAELILTLKKDFIAMIRKNIRDVDIFGKWNNEQFALLLPNVDFRAAQSLAKKLQGLLHEHKFTRMGKLSCSFGITSIAPKDTLGTFRTRAESALALATSRSDGSIEVKLLV